MEDIRVLMAVVRIDIFMPIYNTLYCIYSICFCLIVLKNYSTGISGSLKRLPTGWTTGVRFPAGARGLTFRHPVQTVSEAHAASCPTGDFSPRINEGRLGLISHSRPAYTL
jgi:hypothetical protein